MVRFNNMMLKYILNGNICKCYIVARIVLKLSINTTKYESEYF